LTKTNKLLFFEAQRSLFILDKGLLGGEMFIIKKGLSE